MGPACISRLLHVGLLLWGKERAVDALRASSIEQKNKKKPIPPPGGMEFQENPFVSIIECPASFRNGKTSHYCLRKYPYLLDMSRKITVTSGNEEIVCREVRIAGQVDAQTPQPCLISRRGNVGHMDLTASKLS